MSIPFEEIILIVSGVPWFVVVGLAALGFFVSWLWYGVLFKKIWMRLSNQSRAKPSNATMIVRFAEMFTLAYIIALIAQTDLATFMLFVDALIGVVLLVTLSGSMFSGGNIKLWGLNAGFYIVVILIFSVLLRVGG